MQYKSVLEDFNETLRGEAHFNRKIKVNFFHESNICKKAKLTKPSEHKKSCCQEHIFIWW